MQAAEPVPETYQSMAHALPHQMEWHANLCHALPVPLRAWSVDVARMPLPYFAQLV